MYLSEFADDLRIIKFAKFVISQPSRNNVLGCISANVATFEQNSSDSFSNLYNIPFAIIVVFTVISFVLTQTGAIQGISKIFINHDKAENGNSANTSTSHNIKHPERGHFNPTSNSSSTHPGPTSNLAAVSNPPDGTTTSRSIPTITQAPSIFDFVFWLSGLPSSLNLISSVCDKNIRMAICHMTNVCKTSTGIEYVNSSICGLDMSSGFSNFGMALK
ncbi:19498_t:CDS:2, partial [Gigaspora margarita]